MLPNDAIHGPAAGASLADPMRPQATSIVALDQETPGVFTLTLDMSRYEQGLPFQPGQFTMLYLFGTGEVPISISGDPASPQKLVHTIRAVGQVTRQMQQLQCGDVLGVRGPFGNGWPLAAAQGRDVLVVAGGLGLAPLRPLIYQLLSQRDRVAHVSILYGARSPADILYRRELEYWGGRFDVDVSVIVDHAVDEWHGDVGVVTSLMGKQRGEPGNTVAMICGPEIMMRFSIRELSHLGVPDEQIYVSMERNMQCAIGLCGHCQFGPGFVCKDGPVYRFDRIKPYFGIREL